MLHHDERLVPYIADLMDRADVGVIERRGGSRLLKQSLSAGFTLCATQDLDGYNALEFGVTSLINLSHTPGTNHVEDFVWTEPCAGIEGQGRWPLLRRSIRRPGTPQGLCLPGGLARRGRYCLLLPLSRHLPVIPFPGNRVTNLNKTGVRLWA